VSEGPTRSRSADDEQGQRRDRERPPLPEPLPHPVVDNHCHLDIADGDWLDTVDAIQSAASVGVRRIVQIGCDLPGAAWAVEAARTHSALVAGVALHPNEAPRWAAEGRLDEALAEIERLAQAHDKVRAVGETGMDFFRTGPDGHRAQAESFARHVDLAKRLDKTLVIHDRDAHDAVLDVLDAEGAPERWVMHCFSGNPRFARACLDRGAYLSFAGTVTFKNAQPLRDALAITPLDRVLVETDAPFLTPTPFRGRPNASYLVPVTVRAMAETRGDDLAALCAAIDGTPRRRSAAPGDSRGCAVTGGFRTARASSQPGSRSCRSRGGVS
jgi:TatD DNase family protein